MKNYGIKPKILFGYQSIIPINIKKYMKTKSYSDGDLPLKKTLQLYSLIIVVRSVFHEGNNYCP